jgi:hypothetical protein
MSIVYYLLHFFIKINYRKNPSGISVKKDTLNFLVQNRLWKSRVDWVVSDHYTGNIVVYIVFICKCVVYLL